MKKTSFLTVLIFILFSLGSFNLEAQGLTPIKPFIREIPFPKPENLSQEISNAIVMNVKTQVSLISWESEYRAAIYSYKYYPDKGEIYEVTVTIHPVVEVLKELDITYYSTNRKFNDISSADIITQELLSAPPKIYAIANFTDFYVDGTVEIYNSFKKYSKGTWRAFTLKEKEEGKKSIQRYSFVDGRVFKKRRFRKPKLVAASAQEKEMIRLQYEYILKNLKEGLSK